MKIEQVVKQLDDQHKKLVKHELVLKKHHQQLNNMNIKIQELNSEVSEVLSALNQLLKFKKTLDEISLMIRGGIKVAKWTGVAVVGATLFVLLGWEKFLLWLSV